MSSQPRNFPVNLLLFCAVHTLACWDWLCLSVGSKHGCRMSQSIRERHNGLLRCDRALGGDRSRNPVTPRAVVLTVRDFGCLEGIPEVRCADRLPLKW